MTPLSLLAGMTVKVDREHYPLIIAVRLNPYQYIYKSGPNIVRHEAQTRYHKPTSRVC